MKNKIIKGLLIGLGVIICLGGCASIISGIGNTTSTKSETVAESKVKDSKTSKSSIEVTSEQKDRVISRVTEIMAKEYTPQDKIIDILVNEGFSVEEISYAIELTSGNDKKEEVKQEPELTLAQQNAIKKAESYLRFSAFSRQGLIRQLEFEEFSLEDATFSVDSLNIDWNEQAKKKAESYMKHSSFSRQGLLEQLLFEEFTPEQAEIGVQSVGY